MKARVLFTGGLTVFVASILFFSFPVFPSGDTLDLEKELASFDANDHPLLSPPKVKPPGSFKLSSCSNAVYVEHKIAVFTMVTGSKRNYVASAEKLLRSARRHSRVTFSSVLLELKEKPIEPQRRRELERVGWVLCTVPGLPPAKQGELVSDRFVDQFTKLWLWNMVELDTVLYLDSDAYPINDISELLTTRLPASMKIGAARDYWDGWLETFNMGVFIIHPNKADFDLLMSYYHGERPLHYEVKWSEQGFLNAVWPKQWLEIGQRYNAINIMMNLPFWGQQFPKNNISIFHYTIPKPWDCKYQSKQEILDSCRWWAEETSPRRLMRCLNPAIVTNKVSVWSMMDSSTSDNVEAALRQLRSISRHSKITFAPVMLELREKPIEWAARNQLQDGGWTICTVDSSGMAGDSQTLAVQEYAKLQLWGMTELDTVVFLDAQSYVVGDITDLLKTQLPSNKKLGAAPTESKEGFQTGLLVLHPREEDYQFLLGKSNDLKKDEGRFLASLWGNQWYDVGSKYRQSALTGGNTPAVISNELRDVRIVSYPPSIPKDCSLQSPLVAEVCSWRRDESLPKSSPIRLSQCSNSPSVEHKISVWSILSDTVGEKESANAAIKLLESAKRNSNIAFSAVMIEVASQPIVEQGRATLEKAGWTICTLQKPGPLVKLEMWGITELDTILFLSPFAHVIRDITQLLVMRLPETTKLGAVRAFPKHSWSNVFGIDVMLLHPNVRDYYDLISTLKDGQDTDEKALLHIWWYHWSDLGFFNCASTKVATSKRHQWWVRIRHRIHIVLYDNVKPWDCKTSKPLISEACSWYK